MLFRHYLAAINNPLLSRLRPHGDALKPFPHPLLHRLQAISTEDNQLHPSSTILLSPPFNQLGSGITGLGFRIGPKGFQVSRTEFGIWVGRRRQVLFKLIESLVDPSKFRISVPVLTRNKSWTRTQRSDCKFFLCSELTAFASLSVQSCEQKPFRRQLLHPYITSPFINSPLQTTDQ